MRQNRSRDVKEPTVQFEKGGGNFPGGVVYLSHIRHHASFISWAMVGYSELINNSRFQWRTCMLTSELTVNMLIYNVKRARLVVL